MNSGKQNGKIPILSFYSGGGFLDMGFEMAGFEIVWTNEIDPVFSQLHAAGITSWRKSRKNGIKAEIFNTKSITEIPSNRIVREAFSGKKPEHFGIIGGPPCQDFSIRGKQKGFRGQRGKMTAIYLDKILELKPTFFIMENVPNLVKKKSTKNYLSKLLTSVRKDYYIDKQILNALDHGVPQHRERVFFVGIRKSKIEKEHIKKNGNWFPWPENELFKDAETKYKWPEAVDYGKRLKQPKKLPAALCVEKCLVPHKKINVTPNAREFFNMHVDKEKLQKIKEGETNRQSFKRLHRFKFSPTACYGNNEVHLHPYRHRRLSVREALNIQGVPDTYVLPGHLPLSKKFKMIGNGVPVPLAKAVAGSLLTFLETSKVI